jgi:hypothetical protein
MEVSINDIKVDKKIDDCVTANFAKLWPPLDSVLRYSSQPNGGYRPKI